MSEGPPGRHRRQTEARLLLGGFFLLALVGGGLTGLLYDWTLAAVALAIVLSAAALFGLLWLVLSALEAWARSE